MAALLVGIAGCSGAGPAPQPPAGTTGPTAAEAAFLTDARARPETAPTSDPDLILAGRLICNRIGRPSESRDSITASYVAKWGSTSAFLIVIAAERNLCPGRTYNTPDLTTPPAPASTTPSAPAGPATSFTDGTYEVGPDIVAGKYKSPGPGGDTQCYWQMWKTGGNGGPGSPGYRNDLTSGPQVVTLAQGQTFQAQRCGTWTKTG